jgi:FtsP/CotA-like multicopper oxidase with cupredoxin domain
MREMSRLRQRRVRMLFAFLLFGGFGSSVLRSQPPVLPAIQANNNLQPAGTHTKNVLKLRLVARIGRYAPEADDGPATDVQAFGEENGKLQIPGPLVRVRQGATVDVTIRNEFAGSTLVVHGFQTRPGVASEPMTIPSGESRQTIFLAGRPGTYLYWATTSGATDLERGFPPNASAVTPYNRAIETYLAGAFIIDPPEAPPLNERIFVISQHAKRIGPPPPPPQPGAAVRPERIPFEAAFVLNGKSWPHTQRLTYDVGDTVRFRVINATRESHPMHLHGFHYRVDSRGSMLKDEIYNPEAQRLVVTETLAPGNTMTMTWEPKRSGNWLFHCHLLFHLDPRLKNLANGFREVPPPLEQPSHMEHTTDAGMAGLVLGIHIRPSSKSVSDRGKPARHIHMAMAPVAERFGKVTGYGFATWDGDTEPHGNPVRVPGAPLILTRGELTRITLINRLPFETTIHWHGMEIESYYDGVPGFGGSPGRSTPMIAPGDQFTLEINPPRAGTFMYHTHSHDSRQLAAGLYGALIVLEPGKTWDRLRDHVLMLGGYPSVPPDVALNGEMEPPSVILDPGVEHRFRLINITPGFSSARFSLTADGKPVLWRAVAKDGADLPPSHAIEAEATRQLSPGEICDFVYTPRTGHDLRLEVTRPDFRPLGSLERIKRPPIRMDFKVAAGHARANK